jgi:hypothetical protein
MTDTFMIDTSVDGWYQSTGREKNLWVFYRKSVPLIYFGAYNDESGISLPTGKELNSLLLIAFDTSKNKYTHGSQYGTYFHPRNCTHWHYNGTNYVLRIRDKSNIQDSFYLELL